MISILSTTAFAAESCPKHLVNRKSGSAPSEDIPDGGSAATAAVSNTSNQGGAASGSRSDTPAATEITGGSRSDAAHPTASTSTEAGISDRKKRENAFGKVLSDHDELYLSLISGIADGTKNLLSNLSAPCGTSVAHHKKYEVEYYQVLDQLMKMYASTGRFCLMASLDRKFPIDVDDYENAIFSNWDETVQENPTMSRTVAAQIVNRLRQDDVNRRHFAFEMIALCKLAYNVRSTSEDTIKAALAKAVVFLTSANGVPWTTADMHLARIDHDRAVVVTETQNTTKLNSGAEVTQSCANFAVGVSTDANRDRSSANNITKLDIAGKGTSSWGGIEFNCSVQLTSSPAGEDGTESAASKGKTPVRTELDWDSNASAAVEGPAKKRRKVAIFLKGTSTWADVKVDSDIRFSSLNFGNEEYTGHRGMLREAARVWIIIRNTDELAKYFSTVGAQDQDPGLEDLDIFLTGHSLGGAFAQVIALYLASHEKVKRVTLMTLASPAVFEVETAKRFDGILKICHHRFFHKRDAVPDMLSWARPSWNTKCRHAAHTGIAGPLRSTNKNDRFWT
ncbi:hypothetical protein DFJ77DRAFT_443893 [Powellomyces hirtus]|nr:hypothetical protein DFJ77DRAFT_443893 [Powellomyces hirtus]